MRLADVNKVRKKDHIMYKLQGDLSELEAKEILLTSNPAYITSKEHDHAEHIKELYDIVIQKTEIKDALNDVKTTYFKSVPQGHLPDDKKNS